MINNGILLTTEVVWQACSNKMDIALRIQNLTAIHTKRRIRIKNFTATKKLKKKQQGLKLFYGFILRHYVPSGWRVLSVTHNPTNMMFHWGVLTVLCFSFLRTLITDILFTECREEPWCNFDIFSLRSA